MIKLINMIEICVYNIYIYTYVHREIRRAKYGKRIHISHSGSSSNHLPSPC